MDAPPYALHGHTRSMSSLVTILPLSLDAAEWPLSPRQLSPKQQADFHDAVQIPLPPSAPGSEYDGLARDPEKEAPSEPTMMEIPDELRIPLPPSPGEPETQDEASATEEPELSGTLHSSANSLGHSSRPDTRRPSPRLSPATPKGSVGSSCHAETFADLMRIVHRAVNGRNQFLALRRETIQLLRACAANHRLAPLQANLYKRMVEAFRLEKQSSFASLLALSEQVEANSVYLPAGSVDHFDLANPARSLKPDTPWLYGLPLRTQSVILRFLNSLRNDPFFLTDRLSYLTTAQLKGLARPHRHLTSSESPSEPSSSLARLNPRNLQRPRTRNVEIPNVEEISRDPLRLLILGCFDANARSDSKEKARQLDVWSSACARVIEDARPGSDEFCLAVLDIFADLSHWALRPKLELFLMDLMHSGASIVDPAGATSAADSTQDSTANSHPASSSEFFGKAVKALLELIVSVPGGSGVPTAALSLIRATIDKVGNHQTKIKARSFFVFKWFCTSFLSNALLFPERHQILMKSHISPQVRQRIFRELAIRMQKTVSEYLVPRLTAAGSPAVDNVVEKLVSLFNLPPDETPQASPSGLTDDDRLFTVLYAEDVLCIAKTLFPDNSPNPNQSAGQDGGFSTASSVTGSSTLTAGTDEGGLGTISSFTPSISGTSVTSNTFSNDGLLRSEERVADSENNGAPATPLRSRPTTASGLSPNSGKIPIQEFLPELWRMCSSRKSSSSKAQNPDSALFFIDNRDGHLSFRASRSLQGDIDLQTSSDDLAYKAPISAGTTTIMQALARCSLDHTPNGLARGVASSTSIHTSMVAMFKHQLAISQSSHDFSSAHFWFKALQALSSLSEDFQDWVLPEIVSRMRASSQESSSAVILYQEWLFAMQTLRRTQLQQSRHLQVAIGTLQAKMWYMTDVRHSSAYERAFNIASALKSMRGTPPAKRQSVTAWAKQRLRASFGQEKTHAQFLELLSAPKQSGGPNKLTDEQVEITSRWLTQESIENFCRGEERMHRFCLEIRKCAASLVGKSMLDSPVLWSSSLFQARSRFGKTEPSDGLLSRSALAKQSQSFGSGSSASTPNVAYMQSPLFAPNRGLGFSLDKQGPRSPSLNISTGTKISFEAENPQFQMPFSPVSPTGNFIRAEAEEKEDSATDELRKTIVALLISDLGYDLWNMGSETDLWLNGGKSPVAAASQILSNSSFGGVKEATSPAQLSTGMGVQIQIPEPTEVAVSDGTRLEQLKDIPPTVSPDDDQLIFDFAEGYEKLLKMFKLSPDPNEKLQALYELSLLAECQCSSMSALDKSSEKLALREKSIFGKSSFYDQRMSRIRLTRLEEVVANCEERRRGSISSSDGQLPASGMALPVFGGSSSAFDISNALVLVSSLFVDQQYRPTTLFRDLQLIASFVPSSVLDRTPRGTVFWTVGLVAMSLKAETCRLMTDRANEIVNYHLNSSNHREPIRADGKTERSKSRDGPQMQADELSTSQLADAARLYMLSALEGEPAAARELALFYLTHPELVRYVMLPLSKPGEVAKAASLLGSGSDRKGERGGVLDPQTFAIAYHWMEFAANAGDADAQTFLRENSDLGKGL